MSQAINDDAESGALSALAREILEGNDLGDFTIPTKGLYPYQWNWDSIFVALGFAQFDADRAWREIESLFEAQWPDGMLPHIVFREPEPTYFPGPSEWRANRGKWPSSGISQPPVVATIVRKLMPTAPHRAQQLLPAIEAYHNWWHAARDPEQRGLIAVSHHHESGRDNLPDWDEPSAAIDTSHLAAYARKDTDFVDASMRPLPRDYDWYVALLRLGRDLEWDQTRIGSESPFWVADPLTTAILLRAERDLAGMIEHSGRDASAIKRRIDHMERQFDAFWNDELKAYCSIDLRTGRMASRATGASFLAPYAGIYSHSDDIVALLEKWSDAAPYLVPSYDPTAPDFEHKRYWRGPIWIVINYLISEGLREMGADDWADRIRADSRQLLERSGFLEYFSPVDGSGLGGVDFSWTAAMWLAWASPEAQQPFLVDKP